MPEHTPLHAVEEKAGAVFAEEAGWLMPAHFGDPAAEYRQAREQTAVFDLSHRGKVELNGPDARVFLNNLCTNDIKDLPAGSGCEAFLCTVQARVVAHVLVTCLALPDGREAFWLDTEPGQDEKVAKHLDHYLISEQVEIINRTRELAQLHLAGPQAFAILEHSLSELGTNLEELEHPVLAIRLADLGYLRRRDALGVLGYDLVCRRERAEEAWQLLVKAGASPAGRLAREVLRVEAGVPAYGTDIDESNLAPEVGRTAQAISYTKGCYLGQEPIVRIRDLGHVNRTLLGLKVAGSDPVAHGARLLRDGKEAGQVTSSVVSPRLGVIALAYVRRGNEPGAVLEVEAAGSARTAEVVSLPFAGAGAGVS